MSLNAMLWVMYDAPVENPTEMVILYALADTAHDDGRCSFPSQQTIAEKSAGISDRTVRRHLKALEDRGIIRRGDQSIVDGFRPDLRPIVWDLDLTKTRKTTGQNVRSLPNDRTPATERPDTGDRTTGHRRPNDRTPVSDKPLLTLNKPPYNTGERDNLENEFAEWYKTYPRKVGKGQARRAYKTARKKTTAETLLEAVTEFAEETTRQGTEQRFIPYPATWLNGERWEDQPTGSDDRLALIDSLAAQSLGGGQ